MLGNVLLEIKNLRTHFATERGEVRAVDGVDFALERGRTLGIVGESGCGKSVTALSIMGLVPQPPGRIAGGEVFFEGEDLLRAGRAGAAAPRAAGPRPRRRPRRRRRGRAAAARAP